MGALYEPIDDEPSQSWPQDVAKLKLAQTQQRARNDVEAWKKKKQGQAVEQEKPARQLPITDVSGNPTEFRCSRLMLANILAVRDEWEAARMVEEARLER